MDYIFKEREETVTVKELQITYNEKYKIDSRTKEEIFDIELERENGRVLIDKYRELKGLLTSRQIQEIRGKYKLTQKEFALLLALGEKNITRYENGMPQNRSIDILIRSVDNLDNYKQYLTENQKSFSEERYEELFREYNNLKYIKKHKLIEFKSDYFFLNFKTTKVLNIAKYILMTKRIFDKITLQKLLYYIQGMSLAYSNKPAFDEEIQAWKYGPVVPAVYYNDEEIRIMTELEMNDFDDECFNFENINFDEDLTIIINDVVNTYGKLSGFTLAELTHDEEPWKNFFTGERNVVIPKEEIKDYFTNLYDIPN